MGLINFSVYLNCLRTKGSLAYEYNPFHNYLTNENLYIVKTYNEETSNNEETSLSFIIPEGKAVNKLNGEILRKVNNNEWVDKYNKKVDESNIIKYDDSGCELYAVKGSLIDLDTTQFNFDTKHPVDIEILPSYDGSVNLILNDDKNVPRIINSRFSPREKNAYEIVDRIGENDTNIYSSSNFDKDTSLYFLYNSNPIIEYKRLIPGNLQVGQYCFYFTYCDADDNESDFIAESGPIPVFIGKDKDPYSMDGGIKNLNSNKGIKLKLTNLDISYNYLKIYYIRYFADYLQNRVYECKKIYRKYSVSSNELNIQITGNEEAEDIDANLLNITHFNPECLLTQAQCKNMLFFGNIVKNTDNYEELLDCALRIIPKILVETNYMVDNNYYDLENNFGYYNSLNIYNKTGYLNEEFYRFGVVFIYNNGTLSNVYNILGFDISEENDVTYNENSIYYPAENTDVFLNRRYIKSNSEGWVINDGIFNNNLNKRLNSKGVCKLNYGGELNDNTIFGIKFSIPNDVISYLKETLGIRGLFFVRQKRIPTIIALCYILPMDKSLEAPVIPLLNNVRTECFITKEKFSKIKILNITKEVPSGGREIRSDRYDERILDYGYNNTTISQNGYAAICPDFLLNLPYYNLIFNGGQFKLKKITKNSNLSQSTSNERLYISSSFDYNIKDLNFSDAKICTVTEDVSAVALNNETYKLEVGKKEEAFRFKYAAEDNSTYDSGDEDWNKINKATNIVRGVYSPYLAIYSNGKLEYGELYNIYRDLVVDDIQEYQLRMNSSEPFYAISDRYNFENLDENTKVCWRGDCFINTFTYRLNRNFNDSSLPNNDLVIDPKTWKDNYDAQNPEKWKDISRSDVNAVKLGSWITIKVRSSFNYALRSEDHSYVSEKALMGAPRSFYPRKQQMLIGNYKMPDSYLYNDAYRATLGFKCYFTLLDINYIKNTFSNRIQYSEIAILDSFKNNYRSSLSTYFRDYSTEYGSITKLVGFEGYLLVIFEHAIGIAVINERVIAGSGDGEPVFINTGNVLPEELTIITDTYGTQWSESVIKSEAGYVYGVDTIAKKIWRVKGQQIEILSDFKVNKFLVDNISLGERELYPIIGIRNVKTHYNNNKKDIMFTFYDDVYKDEEKVWNLCYNEILGEFITFYSWIPSYSENIDTQFFTFDRKTSKALSLLDSCNEANASNYGLILSNPVLKDLDNNGKVGSYFKYRNTLNEIETINELKFKKDHFGYYKYFEHTNNKITVKGSLNNLYEKMLENRDKVIILYLEITLSNNLTVSLQIAVTLERIVNNLGVTPQEKLNLNLTTDFYLHGNAGIFDIKENLYPTYWYGETHPFEFEFVVNDKIALLKIFSNLVLIANKAEPESFHFEIEGDNYEFSSDKRTMYFRQEATKNLYLNLGSNILYNRYYTDVAASVYTLEEKYRKDDSEYKEKYSKIDRVYPTYEEGLVRQVKSTIFPLYYEKIDTYNDIYHRYHQMKSEDSTYDFANLSGSEIAWDRNLNLFNIVTHIKNNPINLVGRLRGNSMYKEGKWDIQIPSIQFMLKNETEWPGVEKYGDLSEGPLSGESIEIPPIIVNSLYVPHDISNTSIGIESLPNIYRGNLNSPDEKIEYDNINKYVSTSNWTARKEAKIRDKWMKVRVRYSGKNLAVIHSIATLYNISYS